MNVELSTDCTLQRAAPPETAFAAWRRPVAATLLVLHAGPMRVTERSLVNESSQFDMCRKLVLSCKDSNHNRP
jgi:hypothetical protein